MRSKKQIMRRLFFPKASCLLLVLLLLAITACEQGVNESTDTPASMSSATRK